MTDPSAPVKRHCCASCAPQAYKLGHTAGYAEKDEAQQ